MNGWYYDEQLKDPLTSISLHPNKVLNDKGEWVPIDSGGDGERYRRDMTYIGSGYRKEPLVNAIMTEDFNVSIANNWSSINGDDVISGLWTGLRTIAPYISVLETTFDATDKAINSYNSKKKNKNEKSETPVTDTVASAIGKLSKKARGFKNAIEPHLNEQLIVQGTRFAYYAGSGTAFGNLGMKFTIFPKYSESGFITVVEQAKDILDYANGKFRTDDLSMIKMIANMWASTIKDTAKEATDLVNTKVAPKLDEWANKLKEGRESDKITEKAKEVTNDLISTMNLTGEAVNSIADDIISLIVERGLIGWQSAPGGYIPSYRDIDEPIEGTLKLRIGTQYSISSLLCQDATLVFSKVMVKDPFTGNISPLYCDVNLTLTPASKFANERLSNFIGASGSYNIYKDEIAGTLRKKLDAERELINKTYKL